VNVVLNKKDSLVLLLFCVATAAAHVAWWKLKLSIYMHHWKTTTKNKTSVKTHILHDAPSGDISNLLMHSNETYQRTERDILESAFSKHMCFEYY
jgi:hypothetical protein